MTEPTTTFGNALATARSRKGYSQGELGRRVGISGAQISHYERGEDNPTPERIFAIEVELDVNPGDLSQYLGYAPLDRTEPPDLDEGELYLSSYVAETPEHIRKTIDDMLMQHSPSFRKARGG